MRRPRNHAIAVVVLLVATLAMFGDVLLAGDTRLLSHDGDDLSHIFLYWQDFTFTEMRQGHLPLWNPHVYSGVPFLAGFQPALLYPPSWIGFLLSPVRAINIGIALHVFLGGLWGSPMPATAAQPSIRARASTRLSCSGISAWRTRATIASSATVPIAQ
jgi:hypothetical protein